MNDKILLLGNGINRCFEQDSWKNIIEAALSRYSENCSYADIEKLPYSMQIVVASRDHVDEAVKQFCAELCSVPASDEKKQMVSAAVRPFDNVLTTNYSFEIEQALGVKNSVQSFRSISHQTIDGLTPKRKTSGIYKYHEAKGRRIWHIHGDAAAPSSVVLGHYYYGKRVSAVRDRIAAFMREYKYALSHNNSFEPKSWVDIFLMNDVFVLGNSLDLCEYDLYYLLCAKKRNFGETKVRFFVYGAEAPSKERDLMLRAYNVDIIEIDAADYKSFYYSAIERMHEMM